MSTPCNVNAVRRRPTGETCREMFGPLSIEETRADLLRSRAVRKGRSRLAAAI